MVSDEKPAGRRWVLDTETKGTGAQMVPLDKLHDRSRGPRGPVVVREPKPLPEKAAEPTGPRRFKVVDVMTRQVIAEDVGTRDTIAALQGVRSVVDVDLYVWRESVKEWIKLSQRDRRKLWELRGPAA